MRLLPAGYGAIELILQNTRKADFVEWLENQPRGLSAESSGWKDGRFVIVCVYADDPDETGTLSTQRETIKVRVLPNQIDTTEIEVVCKPTASASRRFLLAIANRWPQRRERIAAFIGDDVAQSTNRQTPSSIARGNTMLTLKDVDEQVYLSLQHLNPTVYKIEREQVGDIITYTVRKNGALMGQYRIMPGDADKSNNVYFGSVYAPDDHEPSKEWDQIVNQMLGGDIARRWGERVRGFGMRGWIEQPAAGAPETPPLQAPSNVTLNVFAAGSQQVNQSGGVNVISGRDTTGRDITGGDKVSSGTDQVP